MYPLIQAAITTSLIYLISIRTGFKKSNGIYITIFFLLAGIGFLFKSHLQAETFTYHTIRAKEEVQYVKFEGKSNAKHSLREKLKKKYYDHYEMCNECYKKANEAIDNFPSIDDKKRAEYCFKAGIASLAPGSPTHKLIYAIISIASDVGIDLMNEWNRINTYLLMTQHHADMVAFYVDILNNMEKEKK